MWFRFEDFLLQFSISICAFLQLSSRISLQVQQKSGKVKTWTKINTKARKASRSVETFLTLLSEDENAVLSLSQSYQHEALWSRKISETAQICFVLYQRSFVISCQIRVNQFKEIIPRNIHPRTRRGESKHLFLILCCFSRGQKIIKLIFLFDGGGQKQCQME